MTRPVSTAALGYEICPFTGKVRYESQEAAVDAMKQLVAAREARQKRHRRTYVCGGCGGWHLTSQKRRKR